MSQTADLPCELEGDGNLYGLGIRTGYYLQWLGLILAYHFFPKNVAEAWIALETFQLGMLVTIIWKVTEHHNSEHLYNIDVFIAVIFGQGGGLTSQTAGLIMGSSEIHPSMITTYASTLTNLGFSAVGVWFWFVGIEVLDQTPCEAVVFFFARTSLRGWFASFSKTVACLSLVANVLNAAYITWDSKVQLRATPKLYDALRWIFLPERPSGSPLQQTSHPQHSGLARPVTLATQLVVYTFFILMVEIALLWNDIRDVNTLKDTGQIIPLMMGLALLLRTLKAIIVRRVFPVTHEGSAE
ncbi:hypothetical protein BKA56DRAFT_611526 [Ilyonectria sp. MPI-CAGE-AT-0026]|nr:hypothetical protein BKA56DRAFT_611526 [Ilyonectria sp. MPI-CAGE-AT-0026]